MSSSDWILPPDCHPFGMRWFRGHGGYARSVPRTLVPRTLVPRTLVPADWWLKLDACRDALSCLLPIVISPATSLFAGLTHQHELEECGRILAGLAYPWGAPGGMVSRRFAASTTTDAVPLLSFRLQTPRGGRSSHIRLRDAVAAGSAVERRGSEGPKAVSDRAPVAPTAPSDPFTNEARRYRNHDAGGGVVVVQSGPTTLLIHQSAILNRNFTPPSRAEKAGESCRVTLVV